MARALLIMPPLGFEATYPLGLASLAATLKAAGHDVHGLDLRAGGPSRPDDHLRALSSAAARVNPAITVIETSIRNAGDVRAGAAALAGRGRCVLTGAGAAVAPAFYTMHTGADAAVVGDAEVVVPALLAQPPSEPCRAPGAAPRGFTGKPPAAAIAAIDDLPPPDRDVFPLAGYSGHPLRARRHAAVELSRGCPYACAFCPTPRRYAGAYRFRAAGAVIEELERLHRVHGVDEFWVEDEQPLCDRRRLSELCRLVRERLPGVTLEFPNGLRPDLLDDDLLAELASAGCRGIALGIESGGEETRAALGRPIPTGRLLHLIDRAHRLGIVTTGYFMLGLPGESALDTARTIRAAAALPLHYAHLSVCWPWSPVQTGPTVRQRRLARLRALSYPYIYGSPRRAARLVRAGDLSPGRLPAALLRMVEWISAGAAGGGGW